MARALQTQATAQAQATAQTRSMKPAELSGLQVAAVHSALQGVVKLRSTRWEQQLEQRRRRQALALVRWERRVPLPVLQQE